MQEMTITAVSGNLSPAGKPPVETLNETSNYLGHAWKAASQCLSLDGVAKLSLAASVVFSGYLSATAENMAECVDGVTFAAAASSLVFFGWALGHVTKGNYSEAGYKLMMAGALGSLSHGAYELNKQTNRPPLLATPDAHLIALQEKVDSLNWEVRLSVTPPLPLKSTPLKKAQAENWINAHSCEIQRQAARKIIAATQHITQAEFERSLKHSVDQFNSWLDTQPSKEYAVALLNEGPHKSDRWVTALALHHLQVLPKEVGDYLAMNKFKNYVYIDDATYSCSQAETRAFEISHFLNSSDTLSFIIPYMRDPNCISSHLQKMRAISDPEKEFPKVQVFTSQRMPTVGEVLSEEEVRNMGSSFKMYKATIYFDHKVADWFSVPEEAYEGGKVYKLERSCAEDETFFEKIWRQITTTENLNTWPQGRYERPKGVDTQFIDRIRPPYKPPLKNQAVAQG